MPLLVGAVLAAGVSCDQHRSGDHETRRDADRPGVTAISREDAERAAAAGQTLYVPAYSAITTADNSRLYQLAITLCVRNTDRGQPIVITSVRYHDQGGRPVRDFLKTPLRLAPLAATEFFVREGDTSGGMAASFLVEWTAERVVSAPLVESVMVGTTGNQGISFTCPGRVIADRGG